jgi:hypothetical protein
MAAAEAPCASGLKPANTAARATHLWVNECISSPIHGFPVLRANSVNAGLAPRPPDTTHRAQFQQAYKQRLQCDEWLPAQVAAQYASAIPCGRHFLSGRDPKRLVDICMADHFAAALSLQTLTINDAFLSKRFPLQRPVIVPEAV